MIRFLTRRVVVGLVSLVVFTFLAFWLVEALIPGDFFTPFRLGMTQQEVDALRAQFGTDQPIVLRWWRWVTGFVAGGLGQTTFGFGVGSQLGDVVAPTVFVFVAGMLLAYLIGQWMGRFTGWRSGLRSDLMTLGGISFSTMFPPFLGFLLFTYLAFRLRELRGVILDDPRRTLWSDASFTEGAVLVRMTWSLAIGVVVAMLVAGLVWRWRRARLAPSLGGLIAVGVAVWILVRLGLIRFAADVFVEAMLPLIAFTLLAFGEFMLIMQTGMVGTVNEDYVLTARAKGLSNGVVRDRHAGRNAEMAVVARLAVSVPYLLTGLVIIERAVSWEGIGSFLFRAIEAQDIPAVTSTLAVIGAITLAIRITLDVFAVVLDPRIARAGRLTP